MIAEPRRPRGRMRSGAQLARLAGTEGALVSSKAEAIVAALAPWVRSHQIVDPTWVRPLAYTATFQFPTFALDDLELLTKVPLWIYAIDTILDGDVTAAPLFLGHLERRYGGRGRPPRLPEPLRQAGAMLEELEEALKSYAVFRQLRQHWVDTLLLMVRGMERETRAAVDFRRQGFCQALPQFDEYMDLAVHSIGVPHYYAACMVVKDHGGILPALPSLARLAKLCGAAARLANDFQTAPREQEECRVNAVVLQQAGDGTGVSFEAARAHVLEMAHEYLRLAEEAAHGIDSGTELEHAFVKCARFAVRFFCAYDYRTY